jgi:hypothetical protein
MLLIFHFFSYRPVRKEIRKICLVYFGCSLRPISTAASELDYNIAEEMKLNLLEVSVAPEADFKIYC